MKARVVWAKDKNGKFWPALITKELSANTFQIQLFGDNPKVLNVLDKDILDFEEHKETQISDNTDSRLLDAVMLAEKQIKKSSSQLKEEVENATKKHMEQQQQQNNKSDKNESRKTRSKKTFKTQSQHQKMSEEANHRETQKQSNKTRHIIQFQRKLEDIVTILFANHQTRQCIEQQIKHEFEMAISEFAAERPYTAKQYFFSRVPSLCCFLRQQIQDWEQLKKQAILLGQIIQEIRLSVKNQLNTNVSDIYT